MPCGLAGFLAPVQRAFETPLWAFRQGIEWARWLMSPSSEGWYNLYVGPDDDSIDTEAPVGQAFAGSASIEEWPTLHPTGTGAYTYVVIGVGPGGHESGARTSAYYTVSYVDGVRANPAPAAPGAVSVHPHAGGTVRFVVVVDQAAGPVAAASLRCSWSQIVEPGTPGAVGFMYVSIANATGRHILQFSLSDPSWVHGWLIEWNVRARSAAGTEDANTDVYRVQIDAEGPPALASVAVSCDG